MRYFTILKRVALLFLLMLLCTEGLPGCGRIISVTKGQSQAVKVSLPTANYLVTLQKDVAYGPYAAERLDLCRPENVTHMLPGVIVIHGGGWREGDKQTYDSLCQLLAAKGIVAANINYRLAPKYIWPAQLVDAQLAVRWLRAHAANIGLDPGRLCAWGSSAGGHLAVFLGSLATIHPGDEAGLFTEQSSRLSCVVDEFGPVDLTVSMGVAFAPLLQTLFNGVTFQSNPELYRDASPIFAISSQSAPTLIVQGSQDALVLPGQSMELRQVLQLEHVSVEYDSYNGGHTFKGLSALQRQEILDREVAFVLAHLHLQ